jgi:AcrR family transcriptional regulator
VPARPDPVPARRRPRVSKDFLDAARRRRLATAIAELSDEHGSARLSVGSICDVAHCSRATFYGVFGSSGDALRFTATLGFEELFSGVEAAAHGDATDAGRVAGAIAALGAGAAADPPLARFVLVHSREILLEDGCSGAEAGVGVLARLFASSGAHREPGRREELLACVHLAALNGALRSERLARLESFDSEMAWAIDLVGEAPEAAATGKG